MTDIREQELQQKIDDLTQEVKELKQQVRKFQQMAFGSKSEHRRVTASDDLEPSLFDEAEVEARQSVKEPALEVTVKEHKRRKKAQPAVKDFADMIPPEDVRDVVVPVPDNQKMCPECGSEMHYLGKVLIRQEVVYIPAKLQLVRYYQESYECRECRKNDVHAVVKSVMPQPVIPHSWVSPSALSHVIMQKYYFAVPLYRQESEWKRLKLNLLRATMANWVMIASKEYMIPLCERLHAYLLKEDCIHADETPVQVLNQKERKNTSKSYMWVYSSGDFDSIHKIRLFDFRPTRKGANAADFLEGYTGYLHTDDYAGYNQVEGVKRCLCWAHARRKFMDAKPIDMDDMENTLVKEGLDQIDKLFLLERELKDVSAQKRKEQRLLKARPLLDAFWDWAEEKRNLVLPKSKLSHALNYALTNRKMLETYLEDGRCAISNNLAENSIRPFTVGRKNWLFSGSPKGAQASASVYSLIETCKANGVDPEKYLNYIFKELPNEEKRTKPEVLDKYLPWSPTVQASCK